MGPTARRTTGAATRTSACRRSAPFISLRAENRQGAPTPSNRAGGALGFAHTGPLASTIQTIEDSMVTSRTSPPLQSAKEKLDVHKRHWCNVHLLMWHLCANTACRRARCCRGDPTACFDRNFRQLPEGVQDWFALLAKFQGGRRSIRGSLGRADAARPC